MVKKSTKKEKMSMAKTISSLYLVDEKTKEINQAIGKQLYKRAAIIYWVNIIIFVLLCIPTLVFFISPLLIWLIGVRTDNGDFVKALKLAIAIGLPIAAITALYGGLVFWVLMTRVREFSQANHHIFIYMGVTTVLVCIDDKIVLRINNGYLMDPNLTYNLKIDNDEICRFKLIKKFKFEIDFDWFSKTTRQRLELKQTSK